MANIAIGEGAKNSITKRMQTHITIRMRQHGTVTIHLNASQHNRPRDIGKFMHIKAISNTYIRHVLSRSYGGGCRGIAKALQHSVIIRLRQL